MDPTQAQLEGSQIIRQLLKNKEEEVRHRFDKTTAIPRDEMDEAVRFAERQSISLNSTPKRERGHHRHHRESRSSPNLADNTSDPLDVSVGASCRSLGDALNDIMRARSRRERSAEARIMVLLNTVRRLRADLTTVENELVDILDAL